MVRWSNPSPIREWNVGYAYRKSRTAGVELNKPVRIAGIGAGYSRSAIARVRARRRQEIPERRLAKGSQSMALCHLIASI